MNIPNIDTPDLVLPTIATETGPTNGQPVLPELDPDDSIVPGTVNPPLP